MGAAAAAAAVNTTVNTIEVLNFPFICRLKSEGCPAFPIQFAFKSVKSEDNLEKRTGLETFSVALQKFAFSVWK